MIHTIILTNDQGEERRLTATNGAVHLVQPGEEVVLLDANGQPSKVQLQQDGDDLIVIYENGERVVLEDFYAASGEGEQEEIALSADGEMSATDVSDSMGNLPDANSFSLMRYSTTAYTNFDDGLHTLESQLSLRAMGGAPGFSPSGGDTGTEPVAEVDDAEEPAPAPDEPEVDPGDTRPTVRASIGGELDPDTGRRPVLPGTRDNQIHVLSLDSGDEGTGGERVDSSRGTLVFFGEGNFVYYYNPGAAAGQDVFIVKYPVADPHNPGQTIMISEPLVFIHAGSGEPEWVPPTYCPGGEEEFFDDPDNPRPDPAGIPSIVIASVDNAGEDGSTGGVGDAVYGDNGLLIFNQDGSWDYVMDISNPLPANETETFTVTYTDVNGKVSVETLVIVGAGGGTVTHKPPFSGEIGTPGDPEPTDREIDDAATRAIIKVTSVDTGDTGTGGELVDGSRGNLVFNEDGTFDYNPSPTATPGIDTYIVEYPIEDPDQPGETILVHETLIFRHDGTGTITWEKPAVTGDLDLPLESPDIDRDSAITVTALETSDAGIPGDLVVGDDSSIVFSVDGTFNVLIHEDSDAVAGDTETFRVTYFDNGAQTVTQDIIVKYDGDGGLHVMPFGRDHENTATEGQTGATGDLVGYDVDGGDVVFSTGSVGTYGTLSIDSATGVYNYALDNASNLVQQLADGETVTDTFTYTVTDDEGDSVSHTVEITVVGVDDNVVGEDDSFTLSQNGTSSAAGSTRAGTGAGLMANDSDLDASDTHRITGITVGGATTAIASGGSASVALGSGLLTVHSDGSYSFDTNHGYDGLISGESTTESFTYTITDSQGSTSTATVTFTINGSNDAPIALDDSGTTPEGDPLILDVLANDTDVDDGDSPTIVQIAGVDVVPGQTVILTSGATATLNVDGTITYTPSSTPLSLGETVPDNFIYVVEDNAGQTSWATAWVTVEGTNEGPVATANTASVGENATVSASGTTVAGSGAGLLANDSDADPSDTHRVTGVTIGGTTTAVPDGSSATVALGNGLLTIHSDGSYSFDTNGGYESLRNSQSTTEQFTYTMTDNHGATASSTMTITVNGANDAPAAVDDTASTLEESPVTIAVRANDTDADSGDTMTITHINGTAVTSGQTVSLTSGAEVTLNVDGTVSYNPDTIELSEGDTFDDSFTYTIRDTAGSTSTATANVTVTGINDAPIANADYALGNTPGREVIINVIANDTDADGTIIPGSVDLDPTTAGIQTELVVAGEGVWSTDGNGNISFTPDEALQGQPTGITYSITDDDGATASSTASLEVTFANFDVWFGNDLSGSVDATEFNQSRVLISGMADLLPFSAANGAQAALFSWADASNQQFDVALTSNSQQFVTDVSNYTRPFNGGTDVGAALQYGVNAILNPANGARSYADQLLVILTDATPAQINSQVTAINAAADMARANGITVVFIAIQEAATPGASLEVLRNAASLDLAGNPLLLTAGTYGAVDQSVMINMIAGIAPGHAANILNQPILAIDDQAAVAEDGTVTLNPLDNDNHVSNDALTITHIDGMAVSVGVPVTLASGAQVTLNMDGSITYNPNGQFGALNSGDADLDQFDYTVEDQSGNSVDGMVSVTINGVTGVGPVVVDLDGDGAEFSGRADGLEYDFNGDGQAEQSAWAGNDDAVLIYDQNGDGQINSDAEFAFTQYVEGAQTDLEGLRHFDTNNDGLLDAQDDEFGKFKLWQDANGDGHVNDGEMRTLAEMGIQSIGLYSDGQAYSAADGHVQVHGTTLVTYTDGSTGTAADATFSHVAMALSGENGTVPEVTPQEPTAPETPDLGQLVGEDDPGIVVDADNGETYEIGSPESTAPADVPAEEENVIPFTGPNPEDQAAAAAAAA